MIRGLTAFSFLSTLGEFTSSGLGQTVTLNCNASGFENGLFFWHKMNYGYMVQTVATGSFGKVQLEKHFESSTFKVNNTGNMHYLTISNVSKEDEATYLCQAGSAYKIVFINVTNLSVIDSHKKSYYVKQTSAVSHSAYPGDLVSLKCSLLTDSDQKSCSGEPDVFWIRSGSDKSYPDSIYIDGERSSYCEKRADIQQKCVYNFSKNVNASDAGTYYCAVATCGEILFGIGKSSLSPLDTITIICLLSTVLAISLAVILVLICLINKNKCEHCRGNIRYSSPTYVIKKSVVSLF
uniref:Ig-like domain-containing protein n=1 Tax=Fundulus heteroclitus TaxID=8078 RepID=A0A3Q2PUH6_FUNHE